MDSLKAITVAIAMLSAASALPISLPVAEDTFTTPHGILTPLNGRAATLPLNTNQAALLKFDLSDLPPAFNATNITSAALKIYVVNARSPGDLKVFPITSAWTESAPTNTTMPNFDPNPIATVSAAKVMSKRFIIIDVTAEVIATTNGTTANFGFLLRDTAGQTYIASKEGPAFGPSAELQIDANLALDAAGSSRVPGSLNVGANLNLAGLLRQGSETGTAEPAGRGLIIRRIQSTNSAIGSVVARTDTLTLERDGTPAGWRVVNAANPGQVTITYIMQEGPGQLWYTLVLPNPSTPGTNVLSYAGLNTPTYLRCTFGNAYDLGHFTEVSLSRSPDNNSSNWVGTVISSYNQ